LTIVLLLILAVVWAVVLGPGLIRRRLERGRSGDSIGAFHAQLRVLERAGPVLVAPAYRLHNLSGSVDAAEVPPTVRSRQPQASFSGDSGLTLLRPDAPTTRPVRESGVRRVDPFFGPEACKRRRDVLLSLASVMLVTGLLGAIPALRPLLAVTLFTLVVSVLYVTLVVRLRARAEERNVKLRFLPTPAAVESSIVIRRSAAR
jgi:hypothetical protein